MEMSTAHCSKIKSSAFSKWKQIWTFEAGWWWFSRKQRRLCLIVLKAVGVLVMATCVVFSLTRALSSCPSLSNSSAAPLVQGGLDSDSEIQMRRDFVKQMFKDAWDDYSRWAWGHNELQPLSQMGHNGGIFGNAKIGATIFDSLDTLYIMGLMDEYGKARNFIRDLSFSGIDAYVSVFETNIRLIGGLLSAYALTRDVLYKEKALEIAELLLPAFDTPTGLPVGLVNMGTGRQGSGADAILSELGSFHLEFIYLSEISGDYRFRDKVLKIRQHIQSIDKRDGLYGNRFDVNSGKFSSNHVSIGGSGDSFYEYLLKSSIQTGDTQARQLYDDAMDAFFNNGLVKTSTRTHLKYISESSVGYGHDKVGHLACFAGGMFALGAHNSPHNKNAVRDAELGQNFTNTCHESYIRTTTRIGPEIFHFNQYVDFETKSYSDKGYMLRPEVIESYFVLYRITGERKYRDWGWDAAQAIQKHTKVGPGRGYSGIGNVYSTSSNKDDVQQSFFLAETLKYLYLLFSSRDLVSLDQWVFNTEGHPLPIKGANSNF